MKRNLPAVLVIAFAFLRLCHVHLLWADEDYHLAASINILHGKVPYRDFWYDKPPLSALYYLPIGAHAGWPLRILDSLYILLACWFAFLIARNWWTEAEGIVAAVSLSFFTAFYLPSAVIPFAADAVMLVPHLAAIYCAKNGWPLRAGFCAGVAFLANTKAVFILATCLIWMLPSAALLVIGFATPMLLGFIALLWSGASPGYVEQVWRWGVLYAKGSPVQNPVRNGLVRTLDWAGFHSAIIAGSGFAFIRMARSDRWKLGVWMLMSFAGVALGSRFAPHYFLQLLPPITIAASRGIVLAWGCYRRPATFAIAALALIPIIRFGPHYVSLMSDGLRNRQPRWSDVTMDLDSQDVALKIQSLARAGDTLLVWGYRPDIYVYTRLTSDSRFWDSQPLTGVPADRHLQATTTIYEGPAALNRQELLRSHPAFIVDGLSLMNTKLAPDVYPELRPWMAQYRVVAKTRLSLIYERMPLPSTTLK